MISIILAAGEGTRLMPLTKNLPKSLVKIKNTSMLEHQLKLYEKSNIKSYVVGGYMYQKIKTFTKNVIINEEYSSTNMVYTLFKAKEVFNDDIIISYGDIIFNHNTLMKVVNSIYDISVAIDMNWKKYWSARLENPLEDLETLIQNNNQILEIGKKPNSYSDIQGQFMGLIKISKKILPTIIELYKDCKLLGRINDKPYKKAYMTDFLQELINRSFIINSVKIYDPWVEIDTYNDYMSKITKNRIDEIIN